MHTPHQNAMIDAEDIYDSIDILKNKDSWERRQYFHQYDTFINS